MRIVLLVIGLLGINSSMALGQDWNGSYYCVGEAAGGLSYDARTKKWKGVEFNPKSKFILRLQYIRMRETNPEGPPRTIDDYRVIIKQLGAYSLTCGRLYLEDEFVGIHSDGSTEEVDCIGGTYIFNMKKERFLLVNGEGFIDGTDNNDKTPSIEAGTCTKID
jgi:hypothetical protein